MITPWQWALIAELNGLFRQERLPHGVIIDFGRGHNADHFSTHLMQSLLCEQSSHEPCKQCDNCQLVHSHNFPDLTFTTLLENEKNGKLNKDIKIDQIRGLIHQLTLTNNRGQGKFAIIYPAERMNLAAANSLLKTLEEPTDNAYLILISHHPARLPITIRSRCQQWAFPKPDQQQATEWLVKQGLQPQRCPLLLEAADNDPVYALELAELEYDHRFTEFSTAVEHYTQGHMDAVSVVRKIGVSDPGLFRQLWRSYLLDKIRHLAATALNNEVKGKISQLLQLNQQSTRQLLTEENNLNLQLQLEDVLISLKHIVNR